MSAENREPDEISRIKSEDKTLLRPEDEGLTENEPTRRFAASDAEEAPTAIQNAPDIEATKILAGDETAEEETAPKPKRYGWRFAVGCAVFAVMFVYLGINIRQAYLYDWALPFWEVVQQSDGRLSINGVYPRYWDRLKQDNELLSFNGQRVTNVAQFNHLRTEVKAGDRYTITVRTKGESGAREIGLVAEPRHSWGTSTSGVIFTILFPLVYLLTGLLIFLFRPDDKRAFLLAMMFALPPVAPAAANVMEGLPAWLVAVRLVGYTIASVGCVLWLHFFLVFPERSSLLRRFPSLEYLIYLPFLLIILPNRLIWAWANAGNNIPTSPSLGIPLYFASLLLTNLYNLAGVMALWYNYRQAGEISRRKLRVIVFGSSIGFLPNLILLLLSTITFGRIGRGVFGEWYSTTALALILIVPPIFAYAIARHQIIPVSFIIRRGLQYLLAKNALRLLLALLILGVIWNIAANPSRPLDEILLRNSAGFYIFIFFAAALLLLNRYGLREWIDKNLFRIEVITSFCKR